MNRRLIAFTTRNDTGIATVSTDRLRPSWSECAEQIPGYVTGRDLGPAPMYTLRYRNGRQWSVRQLAAAGVENIGQVVMAVANRTGNISDISVTDSTGGDVTFDFACFREGQ